MGAVPEIAVKEITMAQIGTFTRGEDGTLSGTIRTLSLNVKARCVPSEPSPNPCEIWPDYDCRKAELFREADLFGPKPRAGTRF
jgi:hypothetical protein